MIRRALLLPAAQSLAMPHLPPKRWQIAGPALLACLIVSVCCRPAARITATRESPASPASQNRPADPSERPATTASSRSAATPPSPHASYVDLGHRDVALPFRLLSVPGHKSALLVHERRHPRTSFVRRIDSEGNLGALRETPGRSVVAAVDEPAPTLVTSDGEHLCFESLVESGAAPRCHARRAHFVVPTADALVLIESRRPPKEKKPTTDATPEAPDAKKPKRPRVSQRPAAADRPSRPARKKKKKKKKKRRQPIPMDIVVSRYDGSGELLAETAPSGLRIMQPLAGMGLTDAVAISGGIQLLWYAHVKPEKRGRRWVPRAALRTGRLDVTGRWLPTTLETLFVGERRYGYIEGHGQARLGGHAGRALYLGRRQQARRRPMRPEAWWLDPLSRIGIDEALYAVAPWRLTEAPPLLKTERQIYATLKKRLRGRRRPLDPAQITWTGDRAWMVEHGSGGPGLWSIDRKTGETTTHAAPFSVKRAATQWVSISPSGAVLVAGDATLRTVDENGVIKDAGPRPGIDSPDRGAAVRIGTGWWALTGNANSPSLRTVARVAPAGIEARALDRYAYRDTCALVGGKIQGLFLALDHGRLRVWRLSPEGKTTSLGSYRSPIARGFQAVQSRSGGAIVIGPAANHPDRWIALGVDERGRLSPSYGLPGTKAPKGRRTLQARPGGALVRNGPEITWLDERGQTMARREHDALSTVSSTSCLSGRPGHSHAVGSSPGQFVALPDNIHRACWLSTPQWTLHGDLRLVINEARGLDEHAKLVTLGPWPAHVSKPHRTTSPLRSSLTKLSPRRCSADMVDVGGRFCIDRYEVRLFAGQPLRALSPFFSPSRRHAKLAWSVWSKRRHRVGDLHARATLLPPLPAPHPVKTFARSLSGVRPSGYLTSYAAEKSCESVGKRLCSHEEWTTACRGENDTKFPYGDKYQHGICNVFRYVHPAGVLHGNSSIGHLDPRLHLVHDERGPLLLPTGSLTQCASRWGADAVHDMVGNLDEWVDEKGGAFAGGFYARASRSGCKSVIGVHPRRYFDYSLGTRCCRAVRR